MHRKPCVEEHPASEKRAAEEPQHTQLEQFVVWELKKLNFSQAKQGSSPEREHQESFLPKGIRKAWSPKSGGSDEDSSPLKVAARWATFAWRSMFYGLLARTADQNGSLRHCLDDKCGLKVSLDLARRYLANGKSAVKHVKEQTCYLAAKILKQEDALLPVFTGPDLCPSSDPEEERRRLARRGVLGPGWIYKRCKELMKCPRPSHRAVAMDILQSKMGRDRVSDDFVESTLEDHFSTLTTPRPPLSAREQILLVMVQNKATEIISHCFGGSRFEPAQCIPSANASSGTSCLFADGPEGWLCGSYRERFELFREREEGPSEITVDARGSRRAGGGFGELLRRFAWVSSHYGQTEPASLLENACPAPLWGTSDWQLGKAKVVPIIGGDLVLPFFHMVEKGVKELIGEKIGDEPEPLIAMPVAIPEPDKVRVITKMDEVAAYATLSLQKFMHGRLKAFPLFEFIGKPLNEACWSEHFKYLKEGFAFLSGDYKGATDNLNPELSNSIWRDICSVTAFGDGWLENSVWADLGRKALTGFTIRRSVKRGNRVEWEDRPQVWGQLMGSPMSFPVLCIANAAACVVGLHLELEDVLYKRGPLVVNGDDVAATFRKEHFGNWCEVVSAVGLSPSVGKNYVSDNFIIMNSELRIVHTVDGQTDEVTWKREGFLNQSLLFSIEKKGQEAGTDKRNVLFAHELGPICSALIANVEGRLQKVWRGWFCDWHQDVLRQLLPGISRFCSPDLGGAGIPLLDDHLTLDERRVAAAIANRPQVARPRATKSGWLSKDTKRCSDFYKQYLPSIMSERSDSDLQAEMRNQPVHLEKSSLGNRIRLGFTLAHFLEVAPNPLPGYVPHPELGDQPPSWFKPNPVELADSPSDRERELRRYHAGLWPAVHLHRKVANHEKFELFEGGGCIFCDHSSLHPMDEENVNRWRVPEEELIQWGLLQHHGTPIFGPPDDSNDFETQCEFLRLASIKIFRTGPHVRPWLASRRDIERGL